MSQAMEFGVIVVGAGLVGLSQALVLSRAGVKVALVDPNTPPASETVATGWDSRVYAISPGSVTFLAECGAWQDMDPARVCQVEDMHVVGDDESSRIDFSAYASGLRELACIVENRELQRVLWSAATRASIEIIAPAMCGEIAFGDRAVRLTLADGRLLVASLVIGADGAESWVRARAGIDATTRGYQQTAVVANFAISRPHRGIARQWFRRDGVLALLPLPGDRVSMVWSTDDAHAAQLLAHKDAELAAAVGAASHGTVGDLTVITSAAAFPLRVQQVRRLIGPRLALIGDAAHTVHPLAGQGVNLGFRDARELADVLSARGAQTDCGDYYLLRRYERARREDIAAMRFTTDTLQRLFMHNDVTIGRLRNLGLRLANRQPQLKKLLTRRAVA